jgi:hypothetical protein
MTVGKCLLFLTAGLSLFFGVTIASINPRDSNSLVLTVFSMVTLGLIGRLNELERQIAGHVPEPEPKPELEPSEEL